MSRGIEGRVARLERALAPTTAASWRGRDLSHWPDWALWSHVLGREVSPEEAERLNAEPEAEAMLERIAGEGRKPSNSSAAPR